MVSNIINRFNTALQKFNHFVELIFRGGYPPQLCAIEFNHHVRNQESSAERKSFSLKEILDNGFLWAVPKHRRSIERRMMRRYGFPEYCWKLLEPKNNLIMCPNCGYVHEIGILCVHCYEKIKKETKEMSNAIQNDLKLEPVDREVIVLYENDNKSKDFWKNQRIVELPKKRPEWFHQNLLQPTTQELSDSKEVKPANIV
ncbi:39S ribosomal protein L32, mitochondrial [Leptopilina heterotoma]|uniref:39S ribosomal protein L32, mitochondrial n=1 Tax=Leptopilina heterotoma TaxID=63436 RepID=UPI001CA97AC9|nr:39S ribosomal protein L32, mitochondrial [Leptopilina heterotoma]